jgi:hypothetical protein
MKAKISFLIIILIFCKQLFSQIYPAFGEEIPVKIIGFDFDAMEPSISADGNTLFFNNINDGITTSLFYASKFNDSTFTFITSLKGANQNITPRLDAVASSDLGNHFFWVSTRDYPTQFDNYYHGTFNGTNIVDIGRVHGTFYIYSPGWLIMDAAINYDGTLLYYCNAYFNGCGSLPCKAKLGIAQKQNDSTFNKLSNSDSILKNINDTNYIVYASFVTKDGLELYFTRILKANPFQSEICVSVRTATADVFSLPSIIYASKDIPEAATLSSDQTRIYYHKKVGNVYKLFLRYRTSTNEIQLVPNTKIVSLSPNPVNTILNVKLPYPNQKYYFEIYSQLGHLLIRTSEKTALDISELKNGIYILLVKQDDKIWTSKIVKQ